jgi:hypothetical protein
LVGRRFLDPVRRNVMLVSLREFHERHEPLWWIVLEILALVAVLVFASTL